ncbi:MAG: hypothetical protein KBD31_00840 [Proteobacteria bacterium]|nr:hypothetical protein [Pseudomonadota bacterium]
MNVLKQRKLKVDIVSYFVLIIALAVTSITVINYRENLANLINLTEQNVNKSLLFMSDNVKTLFEDAEDSLVVAEQYATYNIESVQSDPRTIIAQFAKTLDINSTMLSIYIQTESGSFFQLRKVPFDKQFKDPSKGCIPDEVVYIWRTVASNSTNENWHYLDKKFNQIDQEIVPVTPNTIDPRKRDWYLNAVHKKENIWSDVYIFSSSKLPGFTISSPIINPTEGLLGVIAIDMTVISFNDYIEKIKATTNSSILVLNSNKKIISEVSNRIQQNNGNREVETIDSINDEIFRSAYYSYFIDKKNFNIFEHDQKEYLSYISSFESKKMNLFFILYAPTDDFLSEAYHTKNKSIVITIIIALFSIIFLYSFARKISKPIVHLSAQARSIANLEFLEINHKNSNIIEIQDLSESITLLNKSIGMLSKYIPKALAMKLIAVDGNVKIGGNNKNITVFFSDIENFTTISEELPAEYLILHLSEYFDVLTKIILEKNGSIDKYIGDAIMAIWGAPDSDNDQVLNACKSALICQRALSEVGEQWVKLGKPALKTRIGLHTGDAIVGNIGSSDRINFTALGDTVNLAARLEGLNKYYKTSIIVSSSVVDQASKHFVFRILDKVAVKGKHKSITIFELVCEQDNSEYMLKMHYSVLAEEAFNAYLAKDWDRALDFYVRLNNEYPWGHGANTLMINRCNQFKETPPPIDWDGEYHMTEK